MFMEELLQKQVDQEDLSLTQGQQQSKSLLVTLVIFLIILLPVVGVGSYFLGKNNSTSKVVETKETSCTLEAKICPDGSSVGRIGPNCEFAECPQPTPIYSSNANIWYPPGKYMILLDSANTEEKIYEKYGVFDNENDLQLCKTHFDKNGTFYVPDQFREIYEPCFYDMYTLTLYTPQQTEDSKFVHMYSKPYKDKKNRLWKILDKEVEGYFRVIAEQDPKEAAQFTVETETFVENMEIDELVNLTKSTLDEL